MRFKVEQVLVIGLLCALFGAGFARRNTGNIFAPIVGVIGAIFIIRGLIKRPPGMVVAFASLAALSAIAQPIFFFLSKNRDSPEMILKLAVSEAMVLILGCCCFDLWSEWSRPNQSTRQTPGSGSSLNV